jgi:hypothetical protein
MRKGMALVWKGLSLGDRRIALVWREAGPVRKGLPVAGVIP